MIHAGAALAVLERVRTAIPDNAPQKTKYHILIEKSVF
jgi:hypothetical protein